MTHNTQNNTLAAQADHPDWRPLRESDLYRNPASIEDIQDLVNDISGELAALYQQGQIYGVWSLDTLFVDNLGRYHLLPGTGISTAKSPDQTAAYPQFAAFEQMTDDPAWPMGEHTDVYGLGMLIRTLILKTPPQSAMDRLLQDHARLSQNKSLGINRQALRAIDMATGVEINNRLGSMREFISLLNGVAGDSLQEPGAAVSPHSESAQPALQPPPQQSYGAETAVLGAGTAATAAASAVLHTNHGQEQPSTVSQHVATQPLAVHGIQDGHSDVLSALDGSNSVNASAAPADPRHAQATAPADGLPFNTESLGQQASGDERLYGSQSEAHAQPYAAGLNPSQNQSVKPAAVPAAGFGKTPEQARYEEQLAQAQQDDQAGVDEPLSARRDEAPKAMPQPNYAQSEPTEPKPAAVDGLKMQKAQLKSRKRKSSKLPWIILLLIILLGGGFLYINQKGVPEFLARYDIPYLSSIPDIKIPFLSKDDEGNSESSSQSQSEQNAEKDSQASTADADQTEMNGQPSPDNQPEAGAAGGSKDGNATHPVPEESSEQSVPAAEESPAGEQSADAASKSNAVEPVDASDASNAGESDGSAIASAAAPAMITSDIADPATATRDSTVSVTETDTVSASAQGVRDDQAVGNTEQSRSSDLSPAPAATDSSETVQTTFQAEGSAAAAPAAAAGGAETAASTDMTAAAPERSPVQGGNTGSGAAGATPTTAAGSDTFTDSSAQTDSAAQPASASQSGTRDQREEATASETDSLNAANNANAYVDPKAELQAQNYLKTQQAEEARAAEQEQEQLAEPAQAAPETAKQVSKPAASAAPAPKPAAKTEQQPAPKKTAEKKTAQKKPVVRTGTVVFSVYPWGNISINGRKYGATPPLRNIQLKPGTYRITLDNGTDAPVTRSVTVKSGQTSVVNHHF